MKTIVKKILSRTLLRPRHVRHCSQTLYEALLATLRMWDAGGGPLWRERADSVLDRLLAVQQPDGGFDIGYEFSFGRLHRKGESTSPELVGLIALCQYGRRFGLERVEAPARRAAAWIERIYMFSKASGGFPNAKCRLSKPCLRNEVSTMSRQVHLTPLRLWFGALREGPESTSRGRRSVVVVRYVAENADCSGDCG